MNSKRAFLIITASLGPLVPLSYVLSARQWPDHTAGLWGSIDGISRLIYTGNMPLAALGYLLFSWWFWRHTSAADEEGVATTFVAGRGFGLVNLGYLMVLLGSLAWMPLSLYALATKAPLMVPIVLVLSCVALGSLLLAACLWRAQPATRRGAWQRACVGMLFFCLQTVVLDGLIWPLFFSI